MAGLLCHSPAAAAGLRAPAPSPRAQRAAAAAQLRRPACPPPLQAPTWRRWCRRWRRSGRTRWASLWPTLTSGEAPWGPSGSLLLRAGLLLWICCRVAAERGRRCGSLAWREPAPLPSRYHLPCAPLSHAPGPPAHPCRWSRLGPAPQHRHLQVQRAGIPVSHPHPRALLPGHQVPWQHGTAASCLRSQPAAIAGAAAQPPVPPPSPA